MQVVVVEAVARLHQKYLASSEEGEVAVEEYWYRMMVVTEDDELHQFQMMEVEASTMVQAEEGVHPFQRTEVVAQKTVQVGEEVHRQ